MHLAHGELVVVATEDDLFLGTAELVGEEVLMRSGFAGRPIRIGVEDIVNVQLASEHDDVDFA